MDRVTYTYLNITHLIGINVITFIHSAYTKSNVTIAIQNNVISVKENLQPITSILSN